MINTYRRNSRGGMSFSDVTLLDVVTIYTQLSYQLFFIFYIWKSKLFFIMFHKHPKTVKLHGTHEKLDKSARKYVIRFYIL